MSDLATIEDRLRRTYQAVADSTVVTDDELPDPSTFPLINLRGRDSGGGFDLVELDENRGPGRRRLALTAAVTAVVLALGVAAVVARGDSGPHVPSADIAAFAAGWSELPEAPIGGRYAHSAVWTGNEMIVFGGFNDASDIGEQAAGAAAYHPGTNTWRAIAEPPERLHAGGFAVWTGDVVVAFPQPFEWGTDSPELPGAIYDPEADEWRDIALSGVGQLQAGSQVFWTGGRVLVAGMWHSANENGEMNRAALYDPATDTWERLPDAPLVLGSAYGMTPPEAVWTGEEMIYVGVPLDDPADYMVTEDLEPTSDRIAVLALNPQTGRWRELPDVPLAARFSPSVAWTGSQLVVAGGHLYTDAQEEIPQMDGAIFDPASETWEQLPDLPSGLWPGDGGDTGSAAVAGEQLVFFGSEVSPLLFDVATRTWSRGDPYPDGVTLDGSTVSIGDTVLVWGGVGDDGQLPVTGYAYTPG